MVKIFIDPGHGGSDPGATGNGLQEKTLTLQIALALRTILTNEYEGVSFFAEPDKRPICQLKRPDKCRK